MSKIIDVNSKLKQKYFKKSAELSKSIGKNYDELYSNLANDAIKLCNELPKKFDKKDIGKLFRLRQYTDMMKQFDADSDLCCKKTAKLISNAQREALISGASDAKTLVFSDLEDKGGTFAYTWNRPNNEAFANMVGFTSKGSPLLKVLKSHSTDILPKLQRVLRVGVLRGDSSERIASRMKSVGYEDKSHANLVARTETARCYRTANIECYRANSDIISGVVWSCSRQSRTCLACWSMEGKFFKLDEEVPQDHPNGRCSVLPKVSFDGYVGSAVEYEPDNAFNRLSSAEQERILGSERYELYKSGKYSLRDFGTIRCSADWGSSITTAGIADIGKPLPKLKSVAMPDVPADAPAKLLSTERKDELITTMLSGRVANLKLPCPEARELLEYYAGKYGSEQGDLSTIDYIDKARDVNKSDRIMVCFTRLVNSAYPHKSINKDGVYYPDYILTLPQIRCLEGHYVSGYTQGTNSANRSLCTAAVALNGGKCFSGGISCDFNGSEQLAAQIGLLSMHQRTQKHLREIKSLDTTLYRGTNHPKPDAATESFASNTRGSFTNSFYRVTLKLNKDNMWRVLFYTAGASELNGKEFAEKTGYYTPFKYESEVCMLYEKDDGRAILRRV